VQHFQITGQPTVNVPVRKEQRQHFSLRDDQVLELARYAMAIESHYSELAGLARPMDIEWALDGTDGKLYVVQARPETVHASASTTSQTVYHLEGGADPHQDELLCFGRSIGSKVGVGRCVSWNIHQSVDMFPRPSCVCGCVFFVPHRTRVMFGAIPAV